MVFGFSLIAFWVVLLAGVVLKLIGRNERHRLHWEAQMYASMHGWQQISETAWRSLKQDDCILAVAPEYGASTYSLSVSSDGRSADTYGFSRPVFALQFGDFLWENVLLNRPQLSASEVRETRMQWDRTRMLGPGRSAASQSEPVWSVMGGRSRVGDRITCPSCKRNLPGHSQFCTFCGNSV